jgi:aspartate kinase
MLLSTPVIKFGGLTLQGRDRFGDDPAGLLQQCREADSPDKIYELLAEARNKSRAQRLLEVARDFVLPLRSDDRVPVVVVSAFDVATDKLEMLAASIACAVDPSLRPVEKAADNRVAAQRAPREFARLLMSGELRANSALAMTLEVLGQPARSLTGREAGIVTRLGDARYGPAVDAMVQTVHEGYLLELVVQGIIPVVAGFQGYYSDPESGRDEVSILGRGGSNLTAVALADALGQEECTMFSNVDGVYDKPPDRYSMAHKFDVIPAGDVFKIEPFPAVIQPEALAYAVYRGINIWIRDGFDPEAPGTQIICKGEWENVPEEFRRKICSEAN